jgi:uncharacterized protein YdhG (YjbR/CyaY superfamily)
MLAMNQDLPKPTTIDAYIAGFPIETQILLETIRQAIRDMAPEATECISYGIPTFELHGNLVHFAGYKHHIGFYPGAAGIAEFQEAFAGYKSAKGSVQFPINQPLPLEIVQEVVRFRVQQNRTKATKKAALKKKKAPTGA